MDAFFGQGSFLPHGYCFTWTPGLLWTFVGADALIAAAYFSIPLALWRFAQLRQERSLAWVYGLFGAFIFACGTTHVMDVWTLWWPDYWLQALTKSVTAVVSVVTAVALWVLLPRALKIPSVGQLQAAIRDLQAEVRRRQEAEDTAHRAEQSLMAALAGIDAGFMATDREGRITQMDPLAERLTGWSRADALGLPLRQVWQREGLPADVAAQNPVDMVVGLGLAAQAPHLTTLVGRQGRRTPLVVRASVIQDQAGAVRGLALVFRDRTELVQAEVENARLAAIVASSTDAIIGKTLSGQITDWNEAAEQLFGYSADEAVGQPIQMLIPVDRLHEEARIVAELARGASVPPFDTVRVHQSGKPIDVSISVSPIRDAQGRVVGAAKIARDISMQRRTEAALRESEARLRFVLEVARIGDWEVDLVTGATVRSVRHDQCFGYAGRVHDWGPHRFFDHVHEEDRAQVMASYEAALNSHSPWHCRCRVVWPDGSIHWLDIHGALQFDGGRPVRLLGVVMDITRDKLAEAAQRMAERLESENRRIEAANRAKSAFLANMSHELRTPLNAIIGFAELLTSGMVPADSPQQVIFTGHIASSGKHLLQLINDILDLSKVEAGRMEFRPQALDLAEVVQQTVQVLQLTAARQKVSISTDLDPALGPLTLDEARLKQVLYNYLSNAIKFTPEGGTVSIRARATDAEHFVLEVHDTGVGIAAQDVTRLFADFTQLSDGSSKVHQGTGLGLALTKRLVEAQGGRVGLRSTPGVGSVFWAVLNRHHGTDVPGGQRPMGDVPLLFVHEDPAVQQAAVDSLTLAGIRVAPAGTVREAVHMVSQLDYSAMTLSLSLPDDNGLSLVKTLRFDAARHPRHAPVLALSMTARPQRVASFAVADVVAKPIDAQEVVKVLNRLTAALGPDPQVLIIDDDPMAVQLMSATLQGMGISAMARTDARSALAELDALAPDIIVLDLMMPDMDGFDVLDAISRMEGWREVPVVVWTSLSLGEADTRRLQASAEAIVQKGGGRLDGMLKALTRWRERLGADSGHE